ncbi:hypothetical protein EDB87DRAFT_1610194 [Lactarius vividus]|nr:hypothetical protein EDB87DRAFT_1610194 [Lactarius vividus]
MVSFHDPGVILQNSRGVGSEALAHIDGLFIWEFFITLEYDLSVLRGHRPYRWPIWVCPTLFFSKWVTVRLPVAQVEMMLGTEFRMWKHAEDRDNLVHATQYSMPPHLDEYIELIQPTTVSNRAKALRTTYHFADFDSDTAASSQSSSAKITVPGSGVTVDVSCNNSITVSRLNQLYNAVD